MEVPVAARIGAARLLLAQVKDLPTHEAASKLQCAALCETLQQGQLSAEQRAEVSTNVLGLAWFGDHGLRVLHTLVPPEQPFAKRRRTQQNYDAFIYYGSEEFWTHMQDVSVASPAKLDAIIGLCVRIGCRCPSEFSLKLMNSLWLCCSEKSKLATMSHQQKYTLLQHTKRAFDKTRKLAADPPNFVAKLPEDPLVLLRDYPELYKAQFPGEAIAIKPPIDMAAIMSFDLSYNCRGGAGKGAPAAPPTLQLEQGPGIGQMERVANLFMEKMQDITTSQQRMFEVFMMGGANQQRPQPALTAAANMNQALSSFPVRRMPTITFGHDTGSESDARTPPRGAFALEVTPGTPGSASPVPALVGLSTPGSASSLPALVGLSSSASALVGPSSEASALVPASGSHSESVKDMLSMLDEREEEKKDEKKRRKQEEKAAAAAAQQEKEKAAAAQPEKAAAAQPENVAAAPPEKKKARCRQQKHNNLNMHNNKHTSTSTNTHQRSRLVSVLSLMLWCMMRLPGLVLYVENSCIVVYVEVVVVCFVCVVVHVEVVVFLLSALMCMFRLRRRWSWSVLLPRRPPRRWWRRRARAPPRSSTRLVRAGMARRRRRLRKARARVARRLRRLRVLGLTLVSRALDPRSCAAQGSKVQARRMPSSSVAPAVAPRRKHLQRRRRG